MSVSHSSAERSRFASIASRPVGRSDRRTTDRAAVEPVAALVALVAVGAALGLYTVALDDAAPDRDRDLATTTLDRIEREAAVGGVVDPERIAGIDRGSLPPATVELETRHGTWRTWLGVDAPGDEPVPDAVDTAERSVTVRVAPGENVPGTIRVVIHA